MQLPSKCKCLKETQRTMGMKQRTERENSERRTNKTTEGSRRKHKSSEPHPWRPLLSRMGLTLRPKSKSQSLMLVGCREGCFTQFRVAGPASGLGHQKLEEPASWVPFCDGAQHTEDFCLSNSTASSPSLCRWELTRFKERLLQFLQREPGVGHDRCPYVEAHCIWLSL